MAFSKTHGESMLWHFINAKHATLKNEGQAFAKILVFLPVLASFAVRSLTLTNACRLFYGFLKKA